MTYGKRWRTPRRISGSEGLRPGRGDVGRQEIPVADTRAPAQPRPDLTGSREPTSAEIANQPGREPPALDPAPASVRCSGRSQDQGVAGRQSGANLARPVGSFAAPPPHGDTWNLQGPSLQGDWRLWGICVDRQSGEPDPAAVVRRLPAGHGERLPARFDRGQEAVGGRKPRSEERVSLSVGGV